MQILTGTAGSTARPSQGIVTVPVSGAGKPATKLYLEARPGWDDLFYKPTDGAAAVIKLGKGAISALGRGADVVVGAGELGLFCYKLPAIFRDPHSDRFDRFDAVLKATGGGTALLKVIAPAIKNNPVFRVLDDGLTIARSVRTVHKEVTKKPRPLLDYNIEP